MRKLFCEPVFLLITQNTTETQLQRSEYVHCCCCGSIVPDRTTHLNLHKGQCEIYLLYWENIYDHSIIHYHTIISIFRRYHTKGAGGAASSCVSLLDFISINLINIVQKRKSRKNIRLPLLLLNQLSGHRAAGRKEGTLVMLGQNQRVGSAQLVRF